MAHGLQYLVWHMDGSMSALHTLPLNPFREVFEQKATANDVIVRN